MYTLKSFSAPVFSLSPRFSRRSSHPSVQQLHICEVKSKLENTSKYKDLSEEALTAKAKQLINLIEIKDLLQPRPIIAAKQGRRKRTVKNSQDNMVLRLRILDSDDASSAMYSGTLALEFGLNEKSTVLLHWNSTSLVIPYQEPKDTQIDDTYLVVSFSSNTVSQLKEKNLHRSKTCDLLPFVPTSTTASIIEKLAEVIIKYNKEYYYHQLMRNSQMFVKDTLSAIGVSVADSIVDEFLAGSACQTKFKQHQPAKHFFSHEDLDSYVTSLQECAGKNHTCVYELKTLEFWYLKFHAEESNQSTAATHLWLCPRLSCKESVVIAMQTAMDKKDYW